MRRQIAGALEVRGDELDAAFVSSSPVLIVHRVFCFMLVQFNV